MNFESVKLCLRKDILSEEIVESACFYMPSPDWYYVMIALMFLTIVGVWIYRKVTSNISNIEEEGK